MLRAAPFHTKPQVVLSLFHRFPHCQIRNPEVADPSQKLKFAAGAFSQESQAGACLPLHQHVDIHIYIYTYTYMHIFKNPSPTLLAIKAKNPVKQCTKRPCQSLRRFVMMMAIVTGVAILSSVIWFRT